MPEFSYKEVIMAFTITSIELILVIAVEVNFHLTSCINNIIGLSDLMGDVDGKAASLFIVMGVILAILYFIHYKFGLFHAIFHFIETSFLDVTTGIIGSYIVAFVCFTLFLLFCIVVLDPLWYSVV